MGLQPQELQELSRFMQPKMMALITKAIGPQAVEAITAAIKASVQPANSGAPTTPKGFAAPPGVGHSIAKGPLAKTPGMAEGGVAGFASVNPAAAPPQQGMSGGGLVQQADAETPDDKISEQQKNAQQLGNAFDPTVDYSKSSNAFRSTGVGFAAGGMNMAIGGPVVDPNAKPTGPGLPPGDPTSPDNSQVSAQTQPKSATADDQTVQLSKGEFVLDAATVAFFGVSKLKQMQVAAHKALSAEAQGQSQQQGQGLGSPPQGPPPGAPQQAPTPPMPTAPPPASMPNPTEQRIAATNTPKGPPNRSALGI